MACSTPGIPERLHRNERDANQDFSSDQRLFIRVPKNCFEGPGSDVISVNAFKSSRQSTNRDSHSELEDVLLNINAKDATEHYVDWGVVSIGIAELINKNIQHPDQGYSVVAHPFHAPEECMYPHTELVLRRTDNGDEVEVNSKLLKSKIRAHYRDVSTIAKMPQTD